MFETIFDENIDKLCLKLYHDSDTNLDPKKSSGLFQSIMDITEFPKCINYDDVIKKTQIFNIQLLFYACFLHADEKTLLRPQFESPHNKTLSFWLLKSSGRLPFPKIPKKFFYSSSKLVFCFLSIKNIQPKNSRVLYHFFLWSVCFASI